MSNIYNTLWRLVHFIFLLVSSERLFYLSCSSFLLRTLVVSRVYAFWMMSIFIYICDTYTQSVCYYIKMWKKKKKETKTNKRNQENYPLVFCDYFEILFLASVCVRQHCDSCRCRAYGGDVVMVAIGKVLCDLELYVR